MNSLKSLNKVQVWIYRVSAAGQIEILLLRMIPDRGGYWQPVTGGVEVGEPIEDAALREAREETSLSFKGGVEPLNYCFRFRTRWGADAEEYAFALQASALAEVRLDPQEHDAMAWQVLRQDLLSEVQGRLHYETVQMGLTKLFEFLSVKQVGKSL